MKPYGDQNLDSSNRELFETQVILKDEEVKFKNFLVQISRGIWRLEMAINRKDLQQTSTAPEAVELLHRINEQLQAFGLGIIDPTGDEYVSGMRVEIAQFVPGGSGSYLISQTISPGITWQGDLLEPPVVVVKREEVDGSQKS